MSTAFDGDIRSLLSIVCEKGEISAKHCPEKQRRAPPFNVHEEGKNNHTSSRNQQKKKETCPQSTSIKKPHVANMLTGEKTRRRWDAFL
jgi:hypothetical protein